MLRNEFDLKRQLRAVFYGRMSTDKQNPRSPDQQFTTIEETMNRVGANWSVVATYRDSGISGRYTRKRPQFQKMLRDLKSGAVRADLILVDTFERLSRSQESAALRARLSRMGVLVLTADSNFADPTSTSGQALAMVESVRASEEGRIKAHNVLRGKKDCVRLKFWPGGPVPMGYRLRSVMTVMNGVQEVAGRALEPDPETRWIIEEVFRLADEHGWGGSRLARHLNADDRIDDAYKPFHGPTVSDWLDNEIYTGTLVWGKNCTGIVDDVRVVQSLPEAEWERIDEFCEPIVPRDVWDRIQAVRRSRRRPRKTPNDNAQAGDSVVPTAAGVALKYPLSGLVRCAECGLAMVASGTAPYITKSGESRRYVAYVCPGFADGVCENSRRIPEHWLRETVMRLIRERLFFGESA